MQIMDTVSFRLSFNSFSSPGMDLTAFYDDLDDLKYHNALRLLLEGNKDPST